jgi:uncharacterized protein YqiB (DUF1249 family)
VNVFAIVDMSELKEHEKIDLKHLEKLKKRIELDGVLKMGIVADKMYNIIIDGHHRFTSLKKLGYRKIPVVFVDYYASEIIVRPWRDGMKVTKEMIVKAGLTGKKLPPKTSKHMIRINNRLEHISILEEKINMPLERLK